MLRRGRTGPLYFGALSKAIMQLLWSWLLYAKTEGGDSKLATVREELGSSKAGSLHETNVQMPAQCWFGSKSIPPVTPSEVDWGGL